MALIFFALSTVLCFSFIQTGLAKKEVPAVVLTAFGTSLRSKAEKLTRGTTVEFEVVVMNGKVKTELVLDLSGRMIKAK